MLAFAVYKDGRPVEKWPGDFHSLGYCAYLADAGNRPQERAFDCDLGRLACYCPEAVERKLFVRWPVEGFGDPVLRTRLLQSGPALRNLLVELALGRMELIDSQMAAALLHGRALSSALREKIERARRLAGEAATLDAKDRARASAIAEDSLAIGVPAGEELSLEMAEAGIRERKAAGKLAEFKFGCAGFNQATDTKRGGYFVKAFNYATLPFYLSGMEPQPGVVKHDNVLETARLLQSHGLKLKGHPLVWTYTMCLPAHRRAMDFDTCCRIFAERIARDVPPFAGLIDYWDIINEAHDTPWANSLAFTSRQMVELTDLAAKATRAAAPQSKLVVNVCLPFGEYAAGAPGRASTFQYVRSCIDAGVDFDVLGIQFYYGGGLLQYCWDMLEISRILDDYASLGKEIHITELGTPSAMGPDPNAMIKEGNDVGLWHQEWNEKTQADWVEQFYRICMSKPAITGATWWSFSDASGVFWPYSGLLNKEDEPKESYNRLIALRRLAAGG